MWRLIVGLPGDVDEEAKCLSLMRFGCLSDLRPANELASAFFDTVRRAAPFHRTGKEAGTLMSEQTHIEQHLLKRVPLCQVNTTNLSSESIARFPVCLNELRAAHVPNLNKSLAAQIFVIHLPDEPRVLHEREMCMCVCRRMCGMRLWHEASLSCLCR